MFGYCEKKKAMVNKYLINNRFLQRDFDMQNILQKVHIHVPFHYLPQFQETVLQKQMNLEIHFSHNDLNKLDNDQCRQTAEFLTNHGIKITLIPR